jgi:SAM-dependent methyltransferase
MHPYADTFISEKDTSSVEPVYPLECFLDEETGYIKLGCETNPEDRYNLYDYSYTSSNSSFSRNYWDEYAKHVSLKLNLKDASIYEIGSNDGYLSEQFKNLGHTILGIDPSHYMAKLAKERGVETFCEVFSEATSQKITDRYGKADVVVANNVFNHSNDPLDFARGVKDVLNDSGVFVFEVPYWYNTIIDEKFDQIYHEHVSYFTVKSSCELLKQIGLTVFDVEIVDYHGGSIRVYSSVNPGQINGRIADYIKIEEDAGLFREETYAAFMKSVKVKRATFLEKLYSIAKKDIPIVAVGAAAKGNTFLNFYNIDNTVIDYVTDASEHKIGKYTPLTRIPIESDKEVFEQYDEVYAIILSWNISSILKEKLKQINSNITFLDL